MRGGKWIRVVTSGKRRMILLCFIYAPVFTLGLESGGNQTTNLGCELSVPFLIRYRI